LFSLEDCYTRGLLRKITPSPENAQRSLSFARIWLREADITLEAGAARTALVAVYMAYFHAARSILFRDGVREKSHGCIGLYLEAYVQKGLLDERWTLQFDRARSLRHEDQYMLGAEPSLREIRDLIHGAESFIRVIEQIISPE
jgi:uncharacterized protein (UPF0332 family)